MKLWGGKIVYLGSFLFSKTKKKAVVLPQQQCCSESTAPMQWRNKGKWKYWWKSLFLMHCKSLYFWAKNKRGTLKYSAFPIIVVIFVESCWPFVKAKLPIANKIGHNYRKRTGMKRNKSIFYKNSTKKKNLRIFVKHCARGRR